MKGREATYNDTRSMQKSDGRYICGDCLFGPTTKFMTRRSNTPTHERYK